MKERFSIDRKNFPGPVVVTGAGGCIGSWVLSLLARAGVEACAFDLSEDKRRPRLLIAESDLEKIQWRTGDISDGAALTRALEAVRPCAVIHLAALQVPFCKADPIAGAKVNVVGTVNIFEAARGLGIKRIAYASSIAAYGAMDDGHGAMHTLYGAYKYCDEQVAKVYSQDWSIHSVGIRPGVVYGVGRDHGRDPRRRRGQALRRALLGRRVLALCRRGRERLHPRGVARAHGSPGVRYERGARAGRGGIEDTQADRALGKGHILRASPCLSHASARRAAARLPRRLRQNAPRGRHPRDLRGVPLARRARRARRARIGMMETCKGRRPCA